MSKNWRRITNVPVEKFRARDGQFVCTFDVAGKKSVSLAMPADRLHELITSAAAHGLLVSADEYYGKWRALSRYFKTGSVRQREKSILAVIILSFTHPSGGVTTTKKKSDLLRENNRAHLTVNISTTGQLAIAVSDRFVDLDQLQHKAQAANLDRPITIIPTGHDTAVPTTH